ncbi:MAG: M20/M25/M40 family metallo-hydrolase [Bacillota bacterium]
MINRDRIVSEFMKYVQIDSITKKEGNFAQFIIEELKSVGCEVFVDNAGEIVGSNTGNVIARLQGNIDKEPILFSCHMDTVTPGEGIKPIIKDSVIYSDGTTILGADNKAGIAALLEAVRLIQENQLEHGPVEMVFSVAEEDGLLGAKNLDYSKIKAKKALVLDSSGNPGQIIIKGPAQDKVHVKIKGRPAHAGVAPEEGISAIQVAASAIGSMNLLRIDEETTANIGVIQGGQATNIVCPEVEIKAEARSLDNSKLDKQTAHMVECFREAAEAAGAHADIQTERMYRAFVIDEEDEIVKLVKNACARIGLETFAGKTGGGSDTNIFNENGIKAVNLGMGARKPHTLEEHIKIEDLVNTARLVLEIILSA